MKTLTTKTTTSINGNHLIIDSGQPGILLTIALPALADNDVNYRIDSSKLKKLITTVGTRAFSWAAMTLADNALHCAGYSIALEPTEDNARTFSGMHLHRYQQVIDQRTAYRGATAPISAARLAWVAKAMARNDVHYYLHGVYYNGDAGKTAMPGFVATDGHRVHHARALDNGVLTDDMIIHREHVMAVLNDLGSDSLTFTLYRGAPTVDDSSIDIVRTQWHDRDGVLISCHSQAIDGTYPNVSIFAGKKMPDTITIDRSELVPALTKINAIARQEQWPEVDISTLAEKPGHLRIATPDSYDLRYGQTFGPDEVLLAPEEFCFLSVNPAYLLDAMAMPELANEGLKGLVSLKLDSTGNSCHIYLRTAAGDYAVVMSLSTPEKDFNARKKAFQKALAARTATSEQEDALS